MDKKEKEIIRLRVAMWMAMGGLLIGMIIMQFYSAFHFVFIEHGLQK